MPVWDMECAKCKAVYRDRIFRSMQDRENALILCTQEGCNGRLQAKLSAANFTVNGFSAKNGYSK